MIFETYTVIDMGIEVTQIIKIDDSGVKHYIPEDPANADYQAYLASLKETA